MKIGLQSTAIGIFLFTVTTVHAASSDVYENPTVGFSFTKASSWNFISLKQVMDNRAEVQLKDEEIQKAMRERANAPLVAVTKYPEPHDKLNPSLQVLVRPTGPLKHHSAEQILSIMVAGMKQGFQDFKQVGKIESRELGGLKAAVARLTYTVKTPDGREYPTRTRMWVAPNGGYMFMISASGSPEEMPETDLEFDAMIESVKIEP